MEVATGPWNDADAAKVFTALDPMDQLECENALATSVDGWRLLADWGGNPALRASGRVAYQVHALGRRPFAVCGFAPAGWGNVATVALLARSHTKFATALARLGVQIRNQLPLLAYESGFRRLEARTWSGHPTGAQFLELIGFHHEADMEGFGPIGSETFRQYAMILRGDLTHVHRTKRKSVPVATGAV